MGNRAVITCATGRAQGAGIYVHWNGGPESILAFLEVCKRKDVRRPDNDEVYFMARLTQVIANFFGGTDSIGIGTLKQLDCDNHDNGVYVIGRDFEIVDRWGAGSTRIKRVDQLDERGLKQYTAMVEQMTEQLASEAA